MSQVTRETFIQGEIETAAIFADAENNWYARLNGWLLCRQGPITLLRFGVPDSPMAQARIVEREDVAQIWWDLPYARSTGFTVDISLAAEPLDPLEIYFVAELPEGLSVAGMLAQPETVPRFISKSAAQKARAEIGVLDVLQQSALRAFLASAAVLEFSPSATPQVSVLTVLHNRADRTLACLRSLLRSRDISYELIIVDNASSDSTAELLDRLSGVRVMRNKSNLHFLEAANQAADAARGTYLLFLNNDTLIFERSIAEALAVITSSPKAGAVGGKLVDHDGRLQEAGAVIWRNGVTSGYGQGNDPFKPEYMFVREVDYCSGAFLLTPRELFLRLGRFDAAFKPAYFEDADYCLRLKQEGYKVLFAPGALVIHAEHSSFTDPASAIAAQARNKKLFIEKHRALLQNRPPFAAKRAAFADAAGSDGRRLLFIDDQVPAAEQGAGASRALEILRQLHAQGYQITVFPMHGTQLTYEAATRHLPREVEVMTDGSAETLASFLAGRKGSYDYLWISRPHNMQVFKQIVRRVQYPLESAVLVYDAEAFYSIRELHKLRIARQTTLPSPDRSDIVGQEAHLADGAQLILSASDNEAAEFSSRGYKEVYVLGHGTGTVAGEPYFEQRCGIFTVSPIYEAGTPNEDALRWFIRDIFPELGALLPENKLVLSVAGEIRPSNLEYCRAANVRLLGSVPDLAGYYQAHRIFVAPTRFCSGISLKVIEAAAHGLPIVSTPLVASQLGWSDGVELLTAENAAQFAQKCALLYSSAELWAQLRGNAIRRVTQQFSIERFAATMQLITSRACDIRQSRRKK